ncbi:MAG: hypothetical protein ACXAD7_16165 [Candidatus Kariarchaeaceae archaeon]
MDKLHLQIFPNLIDWMNHAIRRGIKVIRGFEELELVSIEREIGEIEIGEIDGIGVVKES